MSERVTMPALGESVTEGTVTRWLKSVGDSVEVDEPLLEVSTDKVDTEIPSPVAGTLTKILVEEDETVEVGAELAVIGDASDVEGDDSDDSAEESDTEEKRNEDGAQPESEETAEETPTTPSAESDEPKKAEAPKKSSGGDVSGGEKVPMPALGESVTEGTVTRWLKSEGDEVAVDEPLLEVSTDKVDTEIPSPVAGTLTKILVQEDETVEVGADLAIIGGEAGGDDAADEPAEEEAPAEPEEKEEAPKKEEPKKDEAPKKDEPKEEPKKEERSSAPAKKPSSTEESPAKAEETDASSYVTPLVRKLAADNGVDLSTLTGTGVGGRIRKQDVLDAAKAAEEAKKAQSAPAPAAEEKPAAASSGSAPAPTTVPQPSDKRGTSQKMTRLRKVIAQRMVESLQVSAQLTAVVEVDMSRVAALRARNKAEFEKREGVKLSYLPFIALATVETLKAFPMLNASVEGEEIVFHGAEHLGIAVDTDRGLLVPVIRDAGDLNIAGIARKVADLAERTRTNKVTPDELGGGTFTISNIGSNGSLLDTPILNQPQVGILGTGAIVKRPVVVQDEYGNDSIAIRHMQYLVLTYDHRVVDGADAGRFLTALKQRLEEGAFEV
ncbi:2-oxoglutarate dehydrogenase, E2 component, dihydrolipoamide succinyltransferase [Mobilicoccus pelagius]|uniref:Dihydrolipoamide acetyltransferase component of pyruvate dehydrogenase complex n=1 Tax=Mobilicoccus pelagius NBRC 104925 TaxID=1089455 RepID=H5UQ50_9MICO|nr:2-oxoglutarate dehydrogenase, E2 component, dihydrolipoamide succinyltransferase [Mobilicoccus pelagius]GAB47855.1 putative dihydrolipoamide acyltransferase [Mobilicoccus pelagius NBRC 104925]